MSDLSAKSEGNDNAGPAQHRTLRLGLLVPIAALTLAGFWALWLLIKPEKIIALVVVMAIGIILLAARIVMLDKERTPKVNGENLLKYLAVLVPLAASVAQIVDIPLPPPFVSAPTPTPTTPADLQCPLSTEENRVIDSTMGNASRNATYGFVTIDGIAAEDGKPGVGPNMWVCVTVKKLAPEGRQLWLMLRLDPRKDLKYPIYFAKLQLSNRTGTYRHYVRAYCATKARGERPRTLMVVSSDIRASVDLQENHNADIACDRTYTSPTRLPEGAEIVSNRAKINRIE